MRLTAAVSSNDPPGTHTYMKMIGQHSTLLAVIMSEENLNQIQIETDPTSSLHHLAGASSDASVQ